MQPGSGMLRISGGSRTARSESGGRSLGVTNADICHGIDREQSRGEDVIDVRPEVVELNSFLVCGLCRGYLIDATSISHCLHACEWEPPFTFIIY